MDSALQLDNDWIISAEQLWEMENPRVVDFVCSDCRVKLIACACDKGRDWKVRPYFKRPEGARHAQWCNMEAQDKLMAEASKTAVLTRNPPPLPIYTRLDLAQENVTVRMPADTEATQSALRHVESADHEPSGPFTDCHNRTARTIRPICRQFAGFPHPHDRGTRLSLPGIAATTYADAFVPIKSAMNGADPGRRIFYGEVRFKEPIAQSDKSVTVTFNTGRWQGPGTQLAHVQIEITGWKKPSVDALMRELHSVWTEFSGQWSLIQQSGEERHRREGEKGYVFFLGEGYTGPVPLPHL